MHSCLVSFPQEMSLALCIHKLSMFEWLMKHPTSPRIAIRGLSAARKRFFIHSNLSKLA
jgi:hypothetical protein